MVAETVTSKYGARLDSVLIDALAAGMMPRPVSLDVVVVSNLFRKILSDLT